MAVMSVRTNSSGGVDTKLGDTLAKALWGDPEREMKLALARSDLATDEYTRQQLAAAIAHTDQQTQAVAEKENRDQAVHDALKASGPARGREILRAAELGGSEAPVAVEDPTIPVPTPRPELVDPTQTSATDPVPVEFLGPMADPPVVPPPLPGEATPPILAAVPSGARPDGGRVTVDDGMPLPIDERFGSPAIAPDPQRFGGVTSEPRVAQPYTPVPEQPEMAMPVPIETPPPAELATPDPSPPPSPDALVTAAVTAAADPNADLPTATGDVLPAGAATPAPQKLPGTVVDNGDGTVTAHMSKEDAEALGLAAAYNNDPAGQTAREAGTAGFTYNPNLNLTPAQQIEAITTGKAPDTAKAAADLAKAEADANAAAQKGEQDLRKEYDNRDETKRFKVIRDHYKDMQGALKRGGGFGDNTAIYAYIKMLDPTSSVMSGEQVTAENAPGIPAALVTKLNGWLTDAKGDKFQKEGRQQMLAEGRAIYETSAATQKVINDIFDRSARKYGVDPALMLVPVEDLDAPAPSDTTTPAPSDTTTPPPAEAATAEPAKPAGWSQEAWDQLTAAEKEKFR